MFKEVIFIMCISTTCPNNKTGVGADFLCSCKPKEECKFYDYESDYCYHTSLDGKCNPKGCLCFEERCNDE